jgi:hypothetical protein
VMARPDRVSFLTGGTTPLTQTPAPPPDAAAPVEGPEELEVEEPEDVAEFVLPATRRRPAPGRRKVDFYIPVRMANEVDDMCEYVRHHFGVKKGEAQEIILKIGVDNRLEIMRHFRNADADAGS